MSQQRRWFVERVMGDVSLMVSFEPDTQYMLRVMRDGRMMTVDIDTATGDAIAHGVEWRRRALVDRVLRSLGSPARRASRSDPSSIPLSLPDTKEVQTMAADLASLLGIKEERVHLGGGLVSIRTTLFEESGVRVSRHSAGGVVRGYYIEVYDEARDTWVRSTPLVKLAAVRVLMAAAQALTERGA